MQRPWKPWIALFLWTLIALFAFGFNWVVGHRGLFVYDTSIVFDGGWRLIQGQVPYRDFVMSHAPGAYLYLASIFAIFGVSYSSYILAACLINVGGTLCVIRTARVLFPESIVPGVIGGVITAIWLQPPTGGLMVEQVAFFYDILALYLVIEAHMIRAQWRLPLYVCSGVAFAYAVLTKQNAGMLFAPALVGVLLLWHGPGSMARWKRIGAWTIGVVCCFALFAGWLLIFSDSKLFWHHAVELPAKLGATRTWSNPGHTLKALCFYFDAPAVQLAACLSIVCGIAGAIFILIRRMNTPHLLVAVFLAVLLPLVHNLFNATALNEPENGYPFLGVSLASAIGAATQLFLPSESGWKLSWVMLDGSVGRPVFWLVACGFSWNVGVYGLFVDWMRVVNQFSPTTTYDESVQLPQLRNVKWGTPTYLSGRSNAVLEKTDFEATVRWLQHSGKNFFVFPMSTMFYGILGRPSPQPWLFFLEDHTFEGKDLPWLDERAFSAMCEHNVEVVVLETDSWLAEYTQIWRLPKLSAWIRDQFVVVAEFGHYQIWAMKSDRVGSVPIR